MIITTSLRENEALIARAQELAPELGADYQPRRKLSLAKCLERFGAFYLLYKDRLSFVNADGSELSFHPDTAVLFLSSEPFSSVCPKNNGFQQSQEMDISPYP